ncbi:MAG: hypothetical protein MHM6MM_008173 [Cercozoa sp. M6MM]
MQINLCITSGEQLRFGIEATEAQDMVELQETALGRPWSTVFSEEESKATAEAYSWSIPLALDELATSGFRLDTLSMHDFLLVGCYLVALPPTNHNFLDEAIAAASTAFSLLRWKELYAIASDVTVKSLPAGGVKCSRGASRSFTQLLQCK